MKVPMNSARISLTVCDRIRNFLASILSHCLPERKAALFVKFCINHVDVERIGLASLSRRYDRLNVIAADLSCRHKSDDSDSFLMHLFF